MDSNTCVSYIKPLFDRPQLIFFQTLGVNSSGDRSAIKKKLKELKALLEKERKAHEKEQKAMEKMQKKAEKARKK